MANVTCFWIEPNGLVQLYFRRFVSKNRRCPCGVYHTARTEFEIVPVKNEKTKIEEGFAPQNESRWPTTCACGYVFAENDVWQIFSDSMYMRPDTGETYTLQNAPPGAMWDATWMPTPPGPDGVHLVVKLPNGLEWMPDEPSANAGRPWKREGVLPKVTCSPSIKLGDYHGWLKDGVLTTT